MTRLKIKAELAPFFTDLPARLASQPSGDLALRRGHRGGTRRDRPALDPRCRCPARSIRTSSPMPACWRKADGALRIAQAEFTPDRLAAEISALAAEPATGSPMAWPRASVGRLDAAERLADLVMKVAGILGALRRKIAPCHATAKAGHPVCRARLI